MNNSRYWIKNNELNIVGSKIKEYRIKKNLSYEKLSNNLMMLGVDINKQSIYKIEKGQRTVIDFEICAFAKCLDVSFDDLLYDFFKNL